MFAAVHGLLTLLPPSVLESGARTFAACAALKAFGGVGPLIPLATLVGVIIGCTGACSCCETVLRTREPWVLASCDKHGVVLSLGMGCAAAPAMTRTSGEVCALSLYRRGIAASALDSPADRPSRLPGWAASAPVEHATSGSLCDEPARDVVPPCGGQASCVHVVVAAGRGCFERSAVAGPPALPDALTPEAAAEPVVAADAPQRHMGPDEAPGDSPLSVEGPG